MRVLAVFLVLCAAGCQRDGEPPSRLRLATTTSTENSGLLAYLLEPFVEGTGIEVQVVAVGTGQALALGRRGDADVVLVHAREREDAFVAAGHGADRREVMWNDFVIAGPPDDPAGVGGTRDAAAALQRIRQAGALFVSRGDDSGTHIREGSLWARAGGVPADGSKWYWQAGLGMGRCLVIADQKRAYLLVDRGTLLAFRGRLDLEVLVEGDPALRNPYGVIRVTPSRNEDAARKLMDFLTSPAGQARIASFRAKGEVLFHPARGDG